MHFNPDQGCHKLQLHNCEYKPFLNELAARIWRPPPVPRRGQWPGSECGPSSLLYTGLTHATRMIQASMYTLHDAVYYPGKIRLPPRPLLPLRHGRHEGVGRFQLACCRQPYHTSTIYVFKEEKPFPNRSCPTDAFWWCSSISLDFEMLVTHALSLTVCQTVWPNGGQPHSIWNPVCCVINNTALCKNIHLVKDSSMIGSSYGSRAIIHHKARRSVGRCGQYEKDLWIHAHAHPVPRQVLRRTKEVASLLWELQQQWVMFQNFRVLLFSQTGWP